MGEDNIIETCRREAQAWINAGIGDGWPLTQAADRIEAQQADIERLRAAGDQLVDALKHARDPGPVAAYKSAAALAEWERIRNGQPV